MIVKQFRLYPDSHWLFFDVIIHHTRAAMYKFLPQCAPHNFDGICRSWVTILEKGDRNGRHFISQPKIGEIHLFMKRTGVGITCHEICHAVHHYFWIRRRCNAGCVLVDYRQSWNNASAREEAFCWVQGEMFRQFCVSFHAKRKVRLLKQRTIRPVREGTKIVPTKKAHEQGNRDENPISGRQGR
jgi:hypothetical protein